MPGIITVGLDPAHDVTARRQPTQIRYWITRTLLP